MVQIEERVEEFASEQVVEEEKDLSFEVYLTGDQAMDLLKEYFDKIREADPNDPILTCKRYQLIAKPDHMSIHEFTKLYIQEKAEPGTIYVSILELTTRVEGRHEEVVNGFKVDNRVSKGAREWKKYYVIYRQEENGEKTEVGKFEKKGEAIDFVKSYAEQFGVNTPFTVEYENRLENSDPVVAVIEPKFGYRWVNEEVPANRYVFFGKGVNVDE